MESRIDDAGRPEFDLYSSPLEAVICQQHPDWLIQHARHLRRQIRASHEALDALERTLNRRINGRRLELSEILPEPASAVQEAHMQGLADEIARLIPLLDSLDYGGMRGVLANVIMCAVNHEHEHTSRSLIQQIENHADYAERHRAVEENVNAIEGVTA